MKNLIIGIDEVGRGSIAGPVTVAALALPTNHRLPTTNNKLKLRDSKKLSKKQREEWFSYLKKEPSIFYSIAHVQAGVIDRINITQAANQAATHALAKLELGIKNYESRFRIQNAKIFLDGGLYLSKSRYPKLKAKTIIRGDEKIKAISLASIVAKVTRDRLMTKLHKKYPKYKFGIHKGYGTKMHTDAIKRYGPSEKHRLTFI